MGSNVTNFKTYDILTESFTVFLCSLSTNRPLAFIRLSRSSIGPYWPAHKWLGRDLKIPPRGRIELYRDLCCYYGLPGSAFTHVRLEMRDVTIWDLYRQLCQEARQHIPVHGLYRSDR